ncbi:GGDEF domain-containing protein [Spirochaetota bacterium]
MTTKEKIKKSQINRELDEFQIRNIKILTHLLEHNAVSDDIVDNLHKSELDYYSVMYKYNLLEKNANIDEKTNLLRFNNNYLTNIIKTASRIYHGLKDHKYNISLVRLDIDDFSKFNNEHGHDVGDKVLIHIADILRNTSRPTDFVIRYGGEEFDLLLPSTDIAQAEIILKKIFNKINNSHVECEGKKLKVTLSAGASLYVFKLEGNKIVNNKTIQKEFKNLQAQADNALYEAKFLGKNRYCFYDDSKKDEYEKIRDQYSKKLY